MPLVVEILETEEQWETAKQIRFQVFVEECHIPEKYIYGEEDHDPNTFHFIGTDIETGQYVATARCVGNPETKEGHIGRMAVLPKFQGRSYGAAMMQAIETFVAEKLDTLKLGSRWEKRGFYEKCGYHYVTGKPYVQSEVTAVLMQKKINKDDPSFIE